MMREKKTPIPKNMRLSGIMLKLGVLFLPLFVLFPNQLFASENPSSEIVVYADSDTENNQTEQSIVYVTEGTVIYGMDHITVETDNTPKTIHPVLQKPVLKKAKTFIAVSKTVKKVSAKKIVTVPEVTTHYTSHQSEESFCVSKQYPAMGTLTFNHSFKAGILKNSIEIPVLFHGKESQVHSYFNSLIIFKVEFFSFTRPPPFA